MRDGIRWTADLQLMAYVGEQVSMEAVLDEFVSNTEHLSSLVHLVTTNNLAYAVERSWC